MYRDWNVTQRLSICLNATTAEPPSQGWFHKLRNTGWIIGSMVFGVFHKKKHENETHLEVKPIMALKTVEVGLSTFGRNLSWPKNYKSSMKTDLKLKIAMLSIY